MLIITFLFTVFQTFFQRCNICFWLSPLYWKNNCKGELNTW